MTIVELCGIPGCGKSTTLRAFKNKYPDMALKLLDFKAIYPPTKVLRGLSKRMNQLKVKMADLIPGLLSSDERLIQSFMGENEDKGLYLAKAIGVYNGVKNNHLKSGVVILDEGIIQHLSSAGFEEELTGCDKLKPIFDKLKNTDYICLSFTCSEEIVAKRITDRHNGKRYDISDRERLLKLLSYKRSGIEKLIEISGFKKIYIDTQKCPEENADIIAGLLKDRIK